METREFLRRYAWVYLYVVAFFLGCAALLLHSVETVGSMQPFDSHPVIVIDAGHGAPDGGATGVSGVKEDQVNLEIARRLEALLALMGCDAIMTRTDGDCIATQGDTIRQKKQSDLRNRTELVNSQASAVLVSIHQNHFPDGRYCGPQVFWAGEAEALAEKMQTALTEALSPESRRSTKRATGVYLMEHIEHPGVLVECGFLSNPEEERKLAAPEHQKKIAAVLAAVLAEYVHPNVS